MKVQRLTTKLELLKSLYRLTRTSGLSYRYSLCYSESAV
nr:MAG TPA: hypothetical protein [Caudoviricetes sp.]